MDNILEFPGKGPTDVLGTEGYESSLTEEQVTQKVLEAVLQEGFKRVVVIGITEEGKLGWSTSFDKPSEVLYSIELFKNSLLGN